jgi:hypothetical protein
MFFDFDFLQVLVGRIELPYSKGWNLAHLCHHKQFRVLKTSAGDSIFGIFLFSSGRPQLLQHIRARYSLRFLAAICPHVVTTAISVIRCRNAGFRSNSFTSCRATHIWISMTFPQTTRMPCSCFGKVSVPPRSACASRRPGCRGRQVGTCCTARFCDMSANSVCSICE